MRAKTVLQNLKLMMTTFILAAFFSGVL